MEMVRRIPHPPMCAMDSAPALRSYHTDLCNSELRVLPLSGLPIRLFSRGTRRDRSAIC
jgi:hypothetical protein